MRAQYNVITVMQKHHIAYPNMDSVENTGMCVVMKCITLPAKYSRL